MLSRIRRAKCAPEHLLAPEGEAHAMVFAALGDATRLALVVTLCDGQPRSIAQLTAGSRLTRQAITKHLRVLESARLVRGVRHGRESRFEFNPEAMDEARRYLELVSREWDRRLGRLKSFIEESFGEES